MNGNHASDLDKAKRQIRALLNLGKDDGAAEAEAENALRFARRLMLRHQLSERDLSEAPRDPHQIAAETEYGTADHFSEGANLSTWESFLGHAIANLIGTVKFYVMRGRQRRTPHGTLVFDADGQPSYAATLTFYGPADDARDATELQAEWSTAIAAMARMRYGGCFRGAGRSYAEGFALALYEKAQALQREERAKIGAGAAGRLNAHETSSALVLVRQTSIMEAKLKRADVWLKKATGIKLRSGGSRGGNRQDSGAFQAGKADGARANFSHQKTRRLGQ